MNDPALGLSHIAAALGHKSWDPHDALNAIMTLREELERAREERFAAAAWVLDRAEQYDNSSAVRAIFDGIVGGLANGEHIKAYQHGELDDLLKLPFIKTAYDAMKRDDNNG
jgi:hypothetical protein